MRHDFKKSSKSAKQLVPRKTSVIQKREWDLNYRVNNHLEMTVESS